MSVEALECAKVPAQLTTAFEPATVQLRSEPVPIFEIYSPSDYLNPDEQDGYPLSTIKAAKEFLDAAKMPMPASSNNIIDTLPPVPTHITMEDDGLSEGANKTSAYAAVILANIDAPEAIPA